MERNFPAEIFQLERCASVDGAAVENKTHLVRYEDVGNGCRNIYDLQFGGGGFVFSGYEIAADGGIKFEMQDLIFSVKQFDFSRHDRQIMTSAVYAELCGGCQIVILQFPQHFQNIGIFLFQNISRPPEYIGGELFQSQVCCVLFFVEIGSGRCPELKMPRQGDCCPEQLGFRRIASEIETDAGCNENVGCGMILWRSDLCVPVEIKSADRGVCADVQRFFLPVEPLLNGEMFFQIRTCRFHFFHDPFCGTVIKMFEERDQLCIPRTVQCNNRRIAESAFS